MFLLFLCLFHTFLTLDMFLQTDKEKPKPLSSLEDSPLLLVNHGYDFTFHLNGYEPYDTTGSGNDVRESRDTAGPYTPSTSHTSRSFNYAFDNSK